MRTAVGRLNQLDPAARVRLESACGFVNAEIAKARRRLKFAAIGCVIIGLVVYALTWRSGQPEPLFGVVAAVVLFVAIAGWEQSQLSTTYKQVVIGRVVAALGQGLSYSERARFSKDDFLAMDLFLREVQTWKTEDEVSGRKDAVAYSMFEADATRTEGSGKNRHTVRIFKGLIVRLDFNKNFRGHTVVVPNADSQIFGGLFGESESRRGKDLCRMDNAAFEETFSVYSTDQQEARYLLTPKLMELIMAACGSFGAIRCSFQQSSVFVTIPSDVDRFQIRLWSPTMTPAGALSDLAACIDLAEQLIDALDLETRIWSKV